MTSVRLLHCMLATASAPSVEDILLIFLQRSVNRHSDLMIMISLLSVAIGVNWQALLDNGCVLSVMINMHAKC